MLKIILPKFIASFGGIRGTWDVLEVLRLIADGDDPDEHSELAETWADVTENLLRTLNWFFQDKTLAFFYMIFREREICALTLKSYHEFSVVTTAEEILKATSKGGV